MSESDWNGDRRSDGIEIAMIPGAFGTLRIVPVAGEPHDYCPCCGALFRTRTAAKMVADRIYPLARMPEPPIGIAEKNGRLLP